LLKYYKKREANAGVLTKAISQVSGIGVDYPYSEIFYQILRRETQNEPSVLVSGDVSLGHCSDGNSVSFHEGLRKNMRRG